MDTPLHIPSATSVMAVAGRRIDGVGTVPPRFPASQVGRVRDEFLCRLADATVQNLICSAASGTDIIALEAAEALQIKRTVVLPFTPDVFRSKSVTDRPGDWGMRFDRIMAANDSQTKVLILDEEETSADAFLEANWSILRFADSFATPRKIACIAWEGQPHAGEDFTAHFLKSALSMSFETDIIFTNSAF